MKYRQLWKKNKISTVFLIEKAPELFRSFFYENQRKTQNKTNTDADNLEFYENDFRKKMNFYENSKKYLLLRHHCPIV